MQTRKIVNQQNSGKKRRKTILEFTMKLNEAQGADDVKHNKGHNGQK